MKLWTYNGTYWFCIQRFVLCVNAKRHKIASIDVGTVGTCQFLAQLLDLLVMQITRIIIIIGLSRFGKLRKGKIISHRYQQNSWLLHQRSSPLGLQS